jgi:hypothetical protein
MTRISSAPTIKAKVLTKRTKVPHEGFRSPFHPHR